MRENLHLKNRVGELKRRGTNRKNQKAIRRFPWLDRHVGFGKAADLKEKPYLGEGAGLRSAEGEGGSRKCATTHLARNKDTVFLYFGENGEGKCRADGENETRRGDAAVCTRTQSCEKCEMAW